MSDLFSAIRSLVRGSMMSVGFRTHASAWLSLNPPPHAQQRSHGWSNAEGHFRRSAKSRASRARAAGQSVSGDLFFDAELEFSASTNGLLSLLAYFAASDSTRDASAILRDKSNELLSLLMWRALGGRSFFVHIEGVGRFDIREGVIHMQPLLVGRPALRRSPSFRNEHMPVVELMVLLARSQNKAAKVSDEFRAASSSLLRNIIQLVGEVVDYHLGFGASDSYFNLPVLRMASGKCRRISMSKKVPPAPPASNSLVVRIGGGISAAGAMHQPAGHEFRRWESCMDSVCLALIYRNIAFGSGHRAESS